MIILDILMRVGFIFCAVYGGYTTIRDYINEFK